MNPGVTVTQNVVQEAAPPAAADLLKTQKEPQLPIRVQGTQTAPSEGPWATVPDTHMCLKIKL